MQDYEIHHIANIWPSMSPDEYEDLRADIEKNGQIEPVVTWRGGVVDGKHRARACADLGVALASNALPDDWDELRVLMHCASLHKRRNLTADQRAMVGACVAEKYRELTKARQVEAAAATNEKRRARDDSEERLVQTEAKRSDPEPSPDTRQSVQRGLEQSAAGKTKPLAMDSMPPNERKASALAAREVGTSRSAVERAAAIRRVDPVLADRVTSGEMKLKQAERVAKAPVEVREKMAAQLETTTRTDAEGDSWGTPKMWIDIARSVMGGIDLDPATNAGAQEVVKATRYHTAEDDGLAQQWSGRVWMNPPYSQPWVTKFSEKLVSHIESGEVTQAMVLVNNATDTRFAQLLLRKCDAVLFTLGRVSFCLPGTDVEIQGTRQGQMLVYFGENRDAFRDACAALGWVGFSA